MTQKTVKILLLILVGTLAVCLFSSCFLLGGGDDVKKVCDLSKCRLSVKNDNTLTYLYGGYPVEMPVDVLDSDGMWVVTVPVGGTDELDLIFQNNVNVGTGTITVSAKSNSQSYKGSTSLNFQIVATQARVSNLNELKKVLNDPNYSSFCYSTRLTIPQGETLEIPSFANVEFADDVNVDGTLINKGSVKWGNVVVNGTFTNTGTLEFLGGKLLDVGHSTFGTQPVKGRGEIFTYDTSDVVSGGEVIVFKRMDLAQTGVTLKQSALDYTGYAAVVDLDIPESLRDKDWNFHVYFENGVDAGPATVRYVADAYSTSFYGEITLEFEILPVATSLTVSVRNDSGKIDQLLSSPNYNKVDVEFKQQYDGAFTVPQGKVLNVVSDFIIHSDSAANIVNNGTVNVAGKMDISRSFTNNGTLAVQGTLNVLRSNVFVNNGTASACGGQFGHDLVNDGRLVLDGTTYFSRNLVNNGSITLGAQAVAFFAEIPQGNAVENNGLVYINAQTDKIQNVSGTVVVRKEIKSENLVTEYSTVKYTGEVLVPTLSFEEDGQAVEVPADTYHSMQSYADNRTGRPKELGVVNYYVTFNNTSTQYFGSAAVQYEIVRAQIAVSYASEFKKALESGFYDQITMAQSFTVTYDITVPEYCEVVIPADVMFVNEGIFTLLGKLTVQQDGVFMNGYVFRDNLIGILRQGEAATVENAGTVVFNGNADSDVSGNVVEKKSIKKAAVTQLSDLFYVRNGNWERYSSQFELSVDEITYTSQDFYVWSGEYEHVGEHVVWCAAKESSFEIYGACQVSTTILPSAVQVSNFDQLKQALGNVNDDGICNFNIIEVTADIDFDITDKTPTEDFFYMLTVPKGAFLDFGNYYFNVTNSQFIATKRLCLQIEGEVSTYHYVSAYTTISCGETGLFTMNIDNENLRMWYNMIRNSSYHVNKIVLLEDLVVPQDASVKDYNVVARQWGDLWIDLNGHSIAYDLEIFTDNNLTVTSSNGEGTVCGVFLHSKGNPPIGGNFATDGNRVVFQNIRFLSMTEEELTQQNVEFVDCVFKTEE